MLRVQESNLLFPSCDGEMTGSLTRMGYLGRSHLPPQLRFLIRFELMLAFLLLQLNHPLILLPYGMQRYFPTHCVCANSLR